ncbi:MAG: hypothetical protein IJ566_06770 [Cardiobacteriaceae bacterium]|nr:hypothetical protein [Cardiobacteriaceae bacterium]
MSNKQHGLQKNNRQPRKKNEAKIKKEFVFFEEKSTFLALQEVLHQDYTVAVLSLLILCLPLTFTEKFSFIKNSFVFIALFLFVLLVSLLHNYKNKRRINNFISFNVAGITYRRGIGIKAKTISWQDISVFIPHFSHKKFLQAYQENHLKKPFELSIKVKTRKFRAGKYRSGRSLRITLLTNDYEQALRFYQITDFCIVNLQHMNATNPIKLIHKTSPTNQLANNHTEEKDKIKVIVKPTPSPKKNTTLKSSWQSEARKTATKNTHPPSKQKSTLASQKKILNQQLNTQTHNKQTSNIQNNKNHLRGK